MSGRVVLALGLAICAGIAFGVPALGLRMLVPSLEDSPRARTTNWRGHSVVMGLGSVWLFWALGLVGVYAVLAIVGSLVASSTPGELIVLLAPAVLLAIVVFAVGMLDDALGSGAERGFAGHLKALASGRLTTGMLKLLVISVASLLVAWYAASELSGAIDAPSYWAYVLFGGLSIALTSNFVNLTDLRPARALKAYGLLVLVGALAQLATILFVSAQTRGFGGHVLVTHGLAIFAALLLLLLGPAMAAWPYDAGERGMLGDAGANPAGAVAGLLIVGSLPLVGVIVYAVVMLALNLASERWSFSAIVEGNRALRWLDGLGRRKDATGGIGAAQGTGSESGVNDG